MADLAYGYMNWPGIEAVVYGEESSPKDVMGPRIVADGILLQGFFPGADHAYVLSGRRSYEMTMEDEKGYFAVVTTSTPDHLVFNRTVALKDSFSKKK